MHGMTGASTTSWLNVKMSHLIPQTFAIFVEHITVTKLRNEIIVEKGNIPVSNLPGDPKCSNGPDMDICKELHNIV